MPIIDYHCHVNPQEIFEDKTYRNITEIWLGADHYKWRLIRSCGVDEKYITGDASDKEKFFAFASSIPKAIGNPLYHWTHLELQRYFDYDKPLSAETAEEVWELCNAKLEAGYSARQIIKDSNVTHVCTTDDPIDRLEWHAKLRDDDTLNVQVLPAFRPDKAVNVEKADFIDYIQKLADVSGIEIKTVEDVKRALSSRLDHFESLGCVASDHGLDYMVASHNEALAEDVFQKALAGEKLTTEEIDTYKTSILLHLAGEYTQRNWIMQLHYGAVRNTNTKMFNALGPDSGFDTLATKDNGHALPAFLDLVQVTHGNLPKTIIYSLNDSDNGMIGSVLGAFQGTEISGKIQQGSAWWFFDNRDGMVDQMRSLASFSVFGNFVGMLTDSRSFLSYTRHEYFRRILCNLVGQWVENGEYPNDEKRLGELIENISYNNTKNYFGFK